MIAFRQWGSIIFVLFGSLHAHAIDTISTGYKLLSGSTVTINAHSMCRNVVNTSGVAHFASTKTSTEWNSFLSSLPLGISAGSVSCPSTAPDPGISNANILYFNGFETGDLAESVNTNYGALDSAVVRSGAYSFKGNGSDTILIAGLNHTSLVVRFGLNVSGGNNDTPGFPPSALRFKNGPITVTTVGTSKLSGVYYPCVASICSSTPISAGTWHLFEAKINVAVAGSVELRVNGTVVVSQAVNLGTTPIAEVIANSGTTLGDGYLDDIVIRTDGYTGEGKILARQFTSATPTYNTWTMGSAGDFEHPWNDTPVLTTTSGVSTGATAAQTAMVSSFSAVPNVSQYPMPLDRGSVASGGGLGFYGDIGGSGAAEGLAQSFTPPTTIQVAGVKIHAGINGTPTDAIRAEIVSGSVTGTVLASGTASFSGTSQQRVASFASPITLTGGTTYYLRYGRTGTRDTTNRYFSLYYSSDTFEGNMFTKANGTWTSQTYDMKFALVGSPDVLTGTSTVNSCKSVIYAKRSTGGGRTFLLRTRYGGINLDKDITSTISTTDAYFASNYFTPTLAQLNTSEVGGFKNDIAAGQEMTISDAWMMCDVVP